MAVVGQRYPHPTEELASLTPERERRLDRLALAARELRAPSTTLHWLDPAQPSPAVLEIHPPVHLDAARARPTQSPSPSTSRHRPTATTPGNLPGSGRDSSGHHNGPRRGAGGADPANGRPAARPPPAAPDPRSASSTCGRQARGAHGRPRRARAARLDRGEGRVPVAGAEARAERFRVRAGQGALLPLTLARAKDSF